MTFHDLCLARFSCRQYQPRAIEPQKQALVMEAVRLAPSAVNRQPWLFYWITEPAALLAVKSCYHREWIASAPAVILCCKNEDEAWTRRYDAHNHADIDIAIAVEHLCLAATEQGLATCWVCNFDLEQLCRQFPLPQGYKPAVIVPIGYPDATDAGRVRKPTAEIWRQI